MPLTETALRRLICSQLPSSDELATNFGRIYRGLIPALPPKRAKRFFVYATAVIVEKGRRYTR